MCPHGSSSGYFTNEADVNSPLTGSKMPQAATLTFLLGVPFPITTLRFFTKPISVDLGLNVTSSEMQPLSWFLQSLFDFSNSKLGSAYNSPLSYSGIHIHYYT